MPEIIFEDGDLDKGMFMDRMSADGYPAPIFRKKKDGINPKTGLFEYGYSPLQAADWLAYEIFLADKAVTKLRWAFKEFDRIPGLPGFYSIQNMQRTDNMLKQKSEGNRIIIDHQNGAYLLPLVWDD